MSREHVISAALIGQAQSAFSRNESWIAYNTQPYYLDLGDMYFFKTIDEARQFAADNVSDYDQYRVMHAHSANDLLRQIPYGDNPEKYVPDPDANGLHHKEGDAFTDALIEHFEQQQIQNNKNITIMNEKNFDYLKDNLKYLGFGEKQHEALENNLKEGKESFQLQYAAEMNKKKFEATLQFRRSDNSDMYFLNSYKATLERSNGEQVDQTFYLNKGKGVTAKEAYNLLEGRAVHKELTTKAGEPYKAWIQLDFENKDKHNNHEVRQYHEKYAYNLKDAVSKFPVQELDGGDKEKSLLQSLQKGNLQSVTVVANGEGQRVFIEANPQYKTVNIYNEKMQRLNQDQRQELIKKPELREGREQGKEQSQEQKQDQKKAKSIRDDDDLDKPRKSRKKGMSM